MILPSKIEGRSKTKFFQLSHMKRLEQVQMSWLTTECLKISF